MLQQTQVERVTGYYERFIKRFPDTRSLARAHEKTVLKCWEGLGYYGRARNMHRAAKLLVREHGGCFPRTSEELMQLPGVGQYTAAAIASIAFGQDVAVVDANVVRVLCRLFCIEDDLRAEEMKKRLWSLAESMLPRGRAGAFNQGLMELGATVCRPGKPKCERCPTVTFCEAAKLGRQDQLPLRSGSKSIPLERRVVAVVRQNEKILIVQRTSGRLLRGLWQFPSRDLTDGGRPEKVLKELLAGELGSAASIIRRLHSVDHGYSHFREQLHAFEVTVGSQESTPVSLHRGKWVTRRSVRRYPLTGAHKKIIAQIDI
jgi:A/G-specific adenine glycosylase